MRFMTKGTSFFTAFTIALALGLPMVAQAQERKSPLADAPAVRRRVELRDKRFEIGVGAGATLGQDFYHAVMVNGRLAFHITDWLALSGWGAFNLTPTFKTSFHERLIGVLPANMPVSTDIRAPTQQQATDGMNRIGEAFAAQLELVPFTGKFGLFSKLFMNYDFYAFGGPGFIDFKADGVCVADPMGKIRGSCPVTGFKIGANFGLGMHLFANDFFALNFEVRDILVPNNPAGRDTNGDMFTDSRDISWDSNYIMSLNLMFFLPGRATISN
jgi:outer membrane beta-barrel protein